MLSTTIGRPLDENDIRDYITRLKIPHFRGIFMRNRLPTTKPHPIECAVINLDDFNGPGSHWTAYWKKGSAVYYFDSFGNLPPPLELIKYFGKDLHIFYNYNQYQDFETIICGHLCLIFLYTLWFKIKKEVML